MAKLHKEYCNGQYSYNGKIKLTDSRKKKLRRSRNDIRKKIKNWFSDNKPNELQPNFWGQGSFEMNTTVNPIPQKDENDNQLLKYDLDYGVYFIEKENSDNKRAIDTWHDWVYDSVEDHTNQDPKRKTTCVRVLFADGHHIDLPIYYKKDVRIELAHRSKDWLESDPKEFYEWFNDKKTPQLERIVRYLKAWKDFRENRNSNLKLPSGFELTILATKNYSENDFDDVAFRRTVRSIHETLNSFGGFKCIRPTTPLGEDVFANYSKTRKDNFLNALDNLLKDLEKARDEDNFKKASEILIDNQFGDRFPRGSDENESDKSSAIGSSLGSAFIKPKPYGVSSSNR